jgi:hypothetical protein
LRLVKCLARFNPRGLNVSNETKQEEAKMYTKPQIVTLENPIKAIQGSCKGCQNIEGTHLVTSGAYEADE